MAEHTAREDVKIAQRQFMDEESAQNVIYVNNKRKIYSAYNAQLDIAFGL